MEEHCAKLTAKLSKETKRAEQERTRAEQERALRKEQTKRARYEAKRADREAGRAKAAETKAEDRRKAADACKGGEGRQDGGRRGGYAFAWEADESGRGEGGESQGAIDKTICF